MQIASSLVEILFHKIFECFWGEGSRGGTREAMESGRGAIEGETEGEIDVGFGIEGGRIEVEGGEGGGLQQLQEGDEGRRRRRRG